MAKLETAARSGATDIPDEKASPFALLAFLTVEVGALVFYLALARTQWFFGDEWDFLARRGVNVGDLLREHGGHWVTVPVLVYRVLWAVVGLHSYLPYVSVAIALHLVCAGLLWVIMRRSGVRPWTSTIAASVFALFGAGAQDFLWAFQVAFSGALAFGLVHLLFATHEGPMDRRDAFGPVAGLLGLMCSGVAIPMVIVVGVASLLRRGWRVAAMQTIPLGVIYCAWWARYGARTAPSATSLGQVVAWFVTGAAGAFGALGGIAVVGWCLGAILVGGLVLVVRESDLRSVREHAAAPIAMLAGAATFLAVVAYTRGRAPAGLARSSRYLDILAALLLPAIALAADVLVRRSRALVAVAVTATMVGVPANVTRAVDLAREQRSTRAATRQLMLSIPRMTVARDVPPTLRPEPDLSPSVTVGWLLDGAADGRFPRARPSTAKEARTNRLRLSLMELDKPSGYPCRALSSPTVVRLEKGEAIGIGGGVVLVELSPHRVQSGLVSFGTSILNPSSQHTLDAVAGPLRLKFFRTGPDSELCVPDQHRA